MNARRQQRRNADIISLQRTGTLLEIDEDNRLICVLRGPDDTPYVGRQWRVAITLPEDYPFKSPSIGFVDHIYHPNVDLASGSVCLNALNHEWTPIYQLSFVMETLLPQLLTYPNAEDPLNHEAAELMLHNSESYQAHIAAYPGYVPT